MSKQHFTITTRIFKSGQGWVVEQVEFPDAGGLDAMHAAMREASRIAHEVDASGEQEWTVDLRDSAGSGIRQLFPGRLN